MPGWASTLLGVAVGGGLTGLVTALTLRWQLGEERKRRGEDALRDRREKGAAAVGPVRALLGDAHPDPLMLMAGNAGMDDWTGQLVRRWEALREPLVVYAAGHPSRQVGQVANQLADAVRKTLYTTLRSMTTVVQRDSADLGKVREEALTDHATAVALADDLLLLVREEVGRVA